MQPSTGGFKVASNRTVYFSKSNLQYNHTTGSWRFAENAWDVMAGKETSANENPAYAGINKWQDLFCWASSGAYHGPTDFGSPQSSTLGDNHDQNMTGTYQDADWGYYNRIINGGNAVHRWRVLTKDEWQYLFSDTQIFGFATVNGVNGIIFIPNSFDWTTSGLKYSKTQFHYTKRDQTSAITSSTNNVLTAAQWLVYENRGAVFFPNNSPMGAFLSSWWRRSYEACAYGFSTCSSWTNWSANKGAYWSSTVMTPVASNPSCFYAYFLTSEAVASTTWDYANYSLGVRPVTTSNTAYATNAFGYDAYLTNSAGGSVSVAFDATHRTCTMTATAARNYTFTHWTKDGNILDASGNATYTPTIAANATYVAHFSKSPSSWTLYKWLSNGISFLTTSYEMNGATAWIYIDGQLKSNTQKVTIDNTVGNGCFRLLSNDIVSPQNAGKTLRIVFFNNCKELVNIIETVIPVVVASNKSLSSITLPTNTYDYSIHVLENVKLTFDNTITQLTFSDLWIYPGAKVEVTQSSAYFYAIRVVMLVDLIGEKYPQLYMPNERIGSWTTYTNGTIGYSSYASLQMRYIVDYNKFYPLFLPAYVTIQTYMPMNFRHLAGGIPGYEVQYYDGAKRATGVSGWTVFAQTAGSRLTERTGYIFFAVPKTWNGTLQNKALINSPGSGGTFFSGSSTARQRVQVTASGNENTPANDRNWNLIGNPFICAISGTGMDGSQIKLGFLRDLNGDGLLTDGTYYDEEVRYITLPQNGFRSYRQVKVSDATIMPFTVFFVQTTGAGYVQFAPASRVLAAPRRTDGAENVTQEYGFDVNISQDSISDVAGMLFGDVFTDGYDLNGDLQKMLGDAQQLSLYTIRGNLKHAFCALPDVEERTSLGFCGADINSPLTISLAQTEDTQWLSELWLIDTRLGNSVDLLQHDYTFTTNTAHNDSRFVLRAVKRANPTISTAMKDAYSANNDDGQEYIYDMLGRRMPDAYNMPKGVYISVRNGVARKFVNR